MSGSVFDACSAEFDAQEDLNGLLQCISEGQAEVRQPRDLVFISYVGFLSNTLMLSASSFQRSHQMFSTELLSLASGVDTFYLIFAGALVYFMQTGFAMLCAGSIRAKNVKNVLLWNLLDSCGGGLAFWACGFAFAYGGDDITKGKTFIGNTDFFLRNDGVDYHVWFFQFAFACALSSIVAGTVAERCKMTAYLCYSVFLVGFVYPVVSRRTEHVLRVEFFKSLILSTSFCCPNRLLMLSGPSMGSSLPPPLIPCGAVAPSTLPVPDLYT